jgi:hypothetical protein
MTALAYCDVPGCEDPNDAGFPRPAFRNGKCSSHMKQLQRTGRTAPIKEKLPTSERLIEAYGRFAEADSDEDYERHKREFRVLAKALGKEEVGAAIREALRRRQARGEPIGRTPKAARENVLATFSEACEVVGAAKAAEITARLHRISRRTVFRYLAVTKGRLLTPPRSARPQRAG